MNITILGCGLVGGPMAMDLAEDRSLAVKVADINTDALEALKNRSNVALVHADLNDSSRLRTIIADSDIVLSAVPGHMGFQTLQTIIEAGKNVVDIAFFAEDPFLLDDLAKKKKVTAIVDCGVMPGMGNMLIGQAASQLDEIEEVLILVGGLPEVREWPYEYRAVFSPLDVIEEYTRPARYMENGKLVIRPALSDVEYVHFPGVGTLEAFNSDGLRTMLKTIPAVNMKEKTMRYPGHVEKIAVLRQTGFFSKEEIEIKGVRLTPLEFTARILFPIWKLKDGDGDLTVMKITVKGRKGGQERMYNFDLLDRYDRQNGIISMARTTGYTATTAVRMLLAGLYEAKGISAPEFIGRHPQCIDFMLRQLAQRGVNYSSVVS